MIAMGLVMGVESLAFLPAIGIQKYRIQIEQHLLEMLYGVNNLPHLGFNLIKLSERIVIHPVEKT